MDVDSVVADLEAATEAVIQEHHGLPAIRFDGTQPDMQCQCGKAHPCSARVLYREAKQAAVALKEMRERQECGICGQQTLTRNPHPDAGKPEHLLTVGATWECIPCNRRALHTAAEQGQEYRRKLTEAVRLLKEAYPRLDGRPWQSVNTQKAIAALLQDARPQEWRGWWVSIPCEKCRALSYDSGAKKCSVCASVFCSDCQPAHEQDCWKGARPQEKNDA